MEVEETMLVKSVGGRSWYEEESMMAELSLRLSLVSDDAVGPVGLHRLPSEHRKHICSVGNAGQSHAWELVRLIEMGEAISLSKSWHGGRTNTSICIHLIQL